MKTACAVLGLLLARGVHAGGAPDVVLVTIDTLRADRVGAYGHPGATTPHLDRLSREGVLLADAHAHVPLTLPSHATLLTGRLSDRLGLPVNGLRLDGATPVLAAALKATGRATAAFVSAAVVDRASGLDRGFDTFDDALTAELHRGAGAPVERDAPDTWDAVRRRLPTLPHPAFLWVHLYDPHDDYRPAAPWDRIAPEAGPPRSLYDGEVALADAHVGKLLAALRRRGESPLVAVVSDHGEGLGDHGEERHGIFLYEPTVHVPAVIAWPGQVPPATRGGLVGLADVGATLADLAGATLPSPDGRSLASALRRGLPDDRTAVHHLESYHGYFSFGWAPLRAVMDDDHKLIQAPRPELYAWRSREADDLHARLPKEAATLRRALDARGAGPSTVAVDALVQGGAKEQMEKLAALGYVASARSDGLLDPKVGIALDAKVRRAAALLELRQVDAGVALLREVLARSPGHVPALSMLGTALLSRGEAASARTLFEQQLSRAVEKELAHVNLGTVSRREGKLAEAERHFREALALRPRLPQAAAGLVECLLASGKAPEALAAAETALAAGARSADLELQRGTALGSAGRKDEARQAFSACLALDPTRHEAMASLGRLAWESGEVDAAVTHYERALRIVPANAPYLATLAAVHQYGRKDLAAALSYYRRALAADPHGPEAANLRELIASLEVVVAGEPRPSRR